MNLDPDERRRMAARARSLRERLETPAGDVDPADDVDEWLAEWRRRVADGDPEAFSDRLDRLDLTVAACRRRLSATEWPADEPLPEWVDRIDDLLAYAGTVSADDLNLGPSDDEIPFEHVLSVVVDYAAERADWSRTPDLSGQVAADFEEWLLGRLHTLCVHPLFIEFKAFVAARDRELALADDPEVPDPPRRYYRSFTADLLDGGLKPFFVEYAALSRLLVVLIDQWIDAIEEFCTHLAEDRTALRETFAPDGRLGPLIEVEFLGDHHQGGRRVFGVTFESGTKIVYKPRDTRAEVAFDEFLGWVGETASFPDFRPPACLSRGDHGWMEWVAATECAGRAGVARYYRRAGMLLALLYALNFTDGHLENVVAVGDRPAIVDLETLVHPTLPDRKRVARDNHVVERIRDSVLRTAFVPMHFPDADLKNIGGLGASEGEQTGVEIPEFENVNTDAMELDYRDTQAITGESLPRFDGREVPPEDHHGEIADGFERMYRFLLDNRAAILEAGGPVETFDDVESRFLVRPTKTYGKVRVPLTTPSFLRSGLKFGLRIETLAKPFVVRDVDPAMWSVYEAEREAIWRFDVPRFTVEATGTELSNGGRPVADIIESTPSEQVRRRIESLDETDLREQLDYLALAYAPERLAYPTPPASPPDDVSRADPDPELAERTARDVFERIRDRARRTREGDVTWYLREYRADGAYLHSVTENLYSGRAGIALFGAALAAAFDEQEYREFADATLSPLLDELDGDDPFPDAKLGGASGLGSLVYVFTTLADLLDDETYVRAARDAASILTPERIRTDAVYDALSGSAGVILGLLPLYERTGDGAVLDRAVVAGEHLLSNRIDWNGVRVWRTIAGDPPQVGVSHGISGIAYALARLADATGEARFMDAALESLEYERARFSPERNNWPDLQSETPTDFSAGWRAGRAGVGLTRLALHELSGEERFRRAATRALDGTDPGTLSDLDNLLDGNYGRVEFLLSAGRTLGDERYREGARRLATAATRRAERAGRFTVAWQTDRWYNPSFFTGEAGIGYALLRSSHPELPCVLRWE